MSLRSCVSVIGFFILLFAAGAGGNMAAAQQGNGTQDQIETPPMSHAVKSDPNASIGSLVDLLQLRMYEAGRAGDLSLCAGNEHCLGDAKRIKSLVCAAAVCDGTDKTKKVVDCFDKIFDQYSIQDRDHIGSAFCALMASPSDVTRQAFLNHIWGSNIPEDKTMQEEGVLKSEAYAMALNGSAETCENLIKDYVGAYGPQWNFEWYKAMSGCRILAHERTREQEEKDFAIWFGVVRGTGNCSDIGNSEMRKACSAPGATSPVPSYAQ